MTREVFAVPATGAGLERRFTKSATWTRALWVCDIMMYKDYLGRTGKPFTHWLEIYTEMKRSRGQCETDRMGEGMMAKG